MDAPIQAAKRLAKLESDVQTLEERVGRLHAEAAAIVEERDAMRPVVHAARALRDAAYLEGLTNRPNGTTEIHFVIDENENDGPDGAELLEAFTNALDAFEPEGLDE